MKRIFALAVSAVVTGCAAPTANLPTHPDVDLQKYVGTWHEQARLPNRFQQDCVGDVRAKYRLRTGQRLQVINQCRLADGSIQTAEGEGRLSRKVDPRNPAQLQVRFAPSWLAWLPAVWGDYWIMRIEGDYQYSLVGTPDRRYLWVLSRDTVADDAVVQRLLDAASAQGFDTDDVILMSN